MSQNWDNLFFKLSLAEALKKVATSITEEARLNNEYAIYFCFDYIHCFNLCPLIRISKIIPSFFFDKASCTRQFESELSLHSLASLFPIKKGFFRIPPSPFSQRELHLSHQASLSSGTRGCNRPTRCSEPLCYKVGGPSKVYAKLCGMGPHGESSLLRYYITVLEYPNDCTTYNNDW